MQAPKEELDNVVEGILFISGQGVELDAIAEKLEISKKDVEESIERLKEKHKDSGINIITYKGSAQLCSNPLYSEDIATVLNPIKEKQLTKAALETAAIIAYKQPVTRLDIEQIRGVNSDYAIQILQNFKLIDVVGRKDAIGKPLLFGTTDEFLKRFELQSIEDLPDYEDLLERIEILHKEFNDGLYRSTEIIPEEDLPDSVSKKEDESGEEKAENLTEETSSKETATEETIIEGTSTTDSSSQDKPNDEDEDGEKLIESAMSLDEVADTLYQSFAENDFISQKDSDLL